MKTNTRKKKGSKTCLRLCKATAELVVEADESVVNVNRLVDPELRTKLSGPLVDSTNVVLDPPPTRVIADVPADVTATSADDDVASPTETDVA